MPALGASNKHRIQANLCVHAKAGRIVGNSDITPNQPSRRFARAGQPERKNLTKPSQM